MALKINGWLMSRDRAVAEIRDNELLVLLEHLLPLYLREEKNSLASWLRLRAVDDGRVNARLLRRALRLTDAAPEELVLSVHAAMITDTYWIKPADQNLRWSDVRFAGNDFADVALFGSFSDLNKPFRSTPEVTNTGSFDKCWRLEEDGWWLYKVGTANNLFSEMAACKLARHFSYPVAEYELVKPETLRESFVGSDLMAGRGVIRTKDFTDNAAVNFEPAVGLGCRSSDPVHNHKILSQISPAIGGQYVEVLTLDALICNVDRHNQNFGVLRDVETGEILSLAPNYDNNLSLLSGITAGMETRSIHNDSLLQEWRAVVQGGLLDITLPELDPRELNEILSEIPCYVPGATVDIDLAEQVILQGYDCLKEVAEQLRRFHQGQTGQVLE